MADEIKQKTCLTPIENRVNGTNGVNLLYDSLFDNHIEKVISKKT